MSENFDIESTSVLPPLDDLPRREPPPSDEELSRAFAAVPSVLYLPAALAWTVVGELAIIVLLLVLLLLD